jgi:hypothetical protein
MPHVPLFGKERQGATETTKKAPEIGNGAIACPMFGR